ncbi:unnamed protein product [Urochloa decumbens]|uniref:C2H2-type domain-containing protein n=1 Tax=Urochloa decumbens TaxID=240449 RepID=A0ABC9FFW8_9POAL
MEFARRGPATAAAADGDAGDGRRFGDPPSDVMICFVLTVKNFTTHVCAAYSALVIRDALQAQLQKDRLRQEIIEAELAKIDRAMALQQGKPVPSTEQLVPRRGFTGAAHDPSKMDERHRSLESKPWKPVTGNRLVTWELTEVTLPVKQPKASERWSCAVCQVEATSEHNLQEHFAGQKHQANVTNLGSRNNGGRQQAVVRALQQEENKSTDMNPVSLRPPSAWGKLPLVHGSNSSEMARHMMSLYFCKVCNVQCSSEVMFEDHRRGKKHGEKVWKLKVRTFCKVCNLQCNSDEMLANHLAGKKHQKNARLMGLI